MVENSDKASHQDKNALQIAPHGVCPPLYIYIWVRGRHNMVPYFCTILSGLYHTDLAYFLDHLTIFFGLFWPVPYQFTPPGVQCTKMYHIFPKKRNRREFTHKTKRNGQFGE